MMALYPETGPTTFDALVAPLPDDVRAAATRLRAIVRRTVPDADEAVSGGAKIAMALYSRGGPANVICGIQPTASGCKLFFHGWEQLAKAGHKLQGSGKHARHVRIASPSDIDDERIAEMVRMAAQHRDARDG